MPLPFEVAPGVEVGGGRLLLIAGPCVIESEEMTFKVARFVKRLGEETNSPVIFKASFDKANRTSIRSFRGPGLEEGLRILAAVREEVGIPVTTDVHCVTQVGRVAEVVDLIQIPAFLCRQTDLVVEAGRTGKPVNVKKGQFLAPEDAAYIVEKLASVGNERVMITERGTTFGYHNLVVDMRSLVTLRRLGVAVAFDATHSVQRPGGLGGSSGGEREFAFPLARAAAAVGIDALFVETHPDPDNALSDGPNMVPLSLLPPLWRAVIEVDKARRKHAQGLPA